MEISHLGGSASNCEHLRLPLCSLKLLTNTKETYQKIIQNQNHFITNSLKLENSCAVPKIDECPRLYSKEGDLCFALFELLKVF